MEDCRLLRNELVLLLFVAELVLKNHAFDVAVVGMDKCNWRVARQVHLSNTTPAQSGSSTPCRCQCSHPCHRRSSQLLWYTKRTVPPLFARPGWVAGTDASLHERKNGRGGVATRAVHERRPQSVTHTHASSKVLTCWRWVIYYTIISSKPSFVCTNKSNV